MKVLLIVSTALMVALTVFAKREPASWSMSSRYEKKPGTEINRSIVQFQMGSSTTTYRPDNPPYGMVLSERVVIGKTVYFITGWAKGARSILFRVFSPEAGNSPLCEVTSFAESAQLKMIDKTLKIEVLESSEQSEISWLNCEQKSQ